MYHCPFTCFKHADSKSETTNSQVNSSQAVLSANQFTYMISDHHQLKRTFRPYQSSSNGSNSSSDSVNVRLASLANERDECNRSSTSSEGFCENDDDGIDSGGGNVISSSSGGNATKKCSLSRSTITSKAKTNNLITANIDSQGSGGCESPISSSNSSSNNNSLRCTNTSSLTNKLVNEMHAAQPLNIAQPIDASNKQTDSATGSIASSPSSSTPNDFAENVAALASCCSDYPPNTKSTPELLCKLDECCNIADCLQQTANQTISYSVGDETLPSSSSSSSKQHTQSEEKLRSANQKSHQQMATSSSESVECKGAKLALDEAIPSTSSQAKSSNNQAKPSTSKESKSNKKQQQSTEPIPSTSKGAGAQPLNDTERRPSKDESSSSSGSQQSVDEVYNIYSYDTSKGYQQKLQEQYAMEKAKIEQGNKAQIFSNIKPTEDAWDILFARAEGLHAHGHGREACRLAVRLASEMLANPPNLMIEIPAPVKQRKGKKHIVNPISHQLSVLASATLAKCAFLCTVLAENSEHYHLAFRICLYALEMQRPPASTKPLEVKLANQEADLLALLKRIPLGMDELRVIRERAEQLKEGTLRSRGEALLPIMLASFIFDALVMPSISGKETRIKVMNMSYRLPTDENLGFEAAVAALGLKANVSEAEHPLLCEGTRRQVCIRLLFEIFKFLMNHFFCFYSVVILH